MRAITRLSSLLAVVAVVLVAAPVKADVSVGLRFGKSFFAYGDNGFSGRVIIGNHPYYRGRYGRFHPSYRKHRQHYRLRSDPFLGRTGLAHSRIGNSIANARRDTLSSRDRHYHDYKYYDRPRRRLLLVPEREVEIETRAVPPPEPEVEKTDRSVVPTPPPEPLDPAGSARLIAARGAPFGPVYEVGDVLPPDQPYVILDPVRFGLPEPGNGELYARVRRDVFLLEIASRRLLEKLEGR